MNLLSIIAEYNPFHLGHKYHLEQSILETNASHTVCIMSGSFVQRGEPSFIDKWTKAKMAIDSGVDLVIELPTVYSIQSAELFGYGAIKILNSLNCVNHISFGAETNDIKKLKNIASILNQEPVEFRGYLKDYLSEGYSFPKARELALISYLDSKDHQYLNILNQSNNILSIEYLKALEKLNSDIEPHIILRQGARYNDEHLDLKFSSATGIRKNIEHKNLSQVKDYISLDTYNHLLNYEKNFNFFNNLNNYTDIFNYLLLTKTSDDLKKIMDMDIDLSNRFLNNPKFYLSIDDFVEEKSTRRYVNTRIQRSIVQLLLELDENILRKSLNYPNQYIRILGSNKKGFEILNMIRKSSDVKIINKFSDYKQFNNNIINNLLDLEIKATNLFFLPYKNSDLINLDFKISPYIKK